MTNYTESENTDLRDPEILALANKSVKMIESTLGAINFFKLSIGNLSIDECNHRQPNTTEKVVNALYETIRYHGLGIKVNLCIKTDKGRKVIFNVPNFGTRLSFEVYDDS